MFVIRIGNTDQLRIAYAVIPSSQGCAFLTADSDGKPELYQMDEITIMRAPIPPYVEVAWQEVLLQDARTTPQVDNA